jgi:hypothetical protein
MIINIEENERFEGKTLNKVLTAMNPLWYSVATSYKDDTRKSIIDMGKQKRSYELNINSATILSITMDKSEKDCFLSFNTLHEGNYATVNWHFPSVDALMLAMFV